MSDIRMVDDMGPRAVPSKQQTNNQGPDFSGRLGAAIADVNNKQQDADQVIEQVIRGETGLHEGMLRLQEADISLRLLVPTTR